WRVVEGAFRSAGGSTVVSRRMTEPEPRILLLIGFVKEGCILEQVGDGEILGRLIANEADVKEGIPALVDRTSGYCLLPEGLQLDYKQQLRVESSSSVAEIARDVLAFSNTEGGLLVVGVADDRAVIGHDAIDG